MYSFWMGDMMMNQWMELFFQGEFGTHLPLRPRVGDRSPYSEGAQVGWQETTPRSHGPVSFHGKCMEHF